MTERLNGVGPAPLRRRDPVGVEPEPGGDDFYTGRELSLFIPERLARGIDRRRNTWTRVDGYAAWLTLAHLILLLVIVAGGSLYLDDLRAQGYALDQPFWHFIMGSNGTHFAPGPRILDWFQSRAFPLEHAPAVVVTLAVRLLLAIGFWRLLRRLFGPHPATLVPFAVLLFTPALIPATTWYRQSITIVACTVAIVWALDAQLRWILYRRRVDLAAVGLATAVAVCFYEKGAAIPVILIAATLAIFAGSRGSGLDRPVRAGAQSAALSGVVVLIFILIYRSGPYDQASGARPGIVDVLHLAWNTSTRTVIPLLLGGPYHWSYPTPYAGVAQLSTTTVMFCLIITVIAAGAAARRAPARTGRAFGVLVAWTLPSVGIVALGRFDSLELVLADAARLWADLVPAFLLAGALAALPWQVGVCRSAPAATPIAATPIDDDGGPTGADGGHRRDDDGDPIEVTVPLIGAGLVMALVLGGSLFSSAQYAGKWWDNPTGQWIANARASLQNAEPYPRTLATPLPENVMPSWVSVKFPSSAPLLLLLRPDIRFHDGDGDAKVMNAAGVRAPYLPNVLAQTKVAALCSVRIRSDTKKPASVRLPKPSIYVPGAQVEVGVLLDSTTKVEVTVVTASGKVLTPQRFSDDDLPAGPHTVRVPAPLGESIRTVRVQADVKENGCVTYARIWAPLT